MGSILSNYGRSSSTPRPVPNVKGTNAEHNREKGFGDSQLLDHGVNRRVPTPEPHIKGAQAQLNYSMGQGHHVNELLSQYGKLKQSAPSAPKVTYDGVDNLIRGQGGEMRKTISQMPLTRRHFDRPPSAPIWS